jgi:hypothetical protein
LPVISLVMVLYCCQAIFNCSIKNMAKIRNHTLYVDILSVVRIDRIIAAIANTISAKRIMPAGIMVLSSVFSSPIRDDDEI